MISGRLRARRPRVVVVVLPGPDAGDVFGPLDVLRSAGRFAEERGAPAPAGYDIEVVSGAATRRLAEVCGLRLSAERSYREVRGRIDTLLFTPLDVAALESEHAELVSWLARRAPTARRVVALCTSAFLLARAGLLDGREATTHWAACELLGREFPRVRVDPEPIFVRDGNVYTSAGATAGMDLALALVEEDFGAEVARAVARFLVLFLRRPGGQSQFSVPLAYDWGNAGPLRDLQSFILQHLHEDLSVERLARQAAMSPRNFRRVFAREVGTTPARFVELARLESARRHLEQTSEGVERIASVCGFRSSERMRVAFLRRLGVSPSEYRVRFASSRRSRSACVETVARRLL